MTGIPFAELQNADLIIDQVFEAGPQKNVSADPLAKLLPVGNQGGFRYNGRVPSPKLVVLYTTGNELAWPDEFDDSTGTLTYFGDNQHPGKELHETSRSGNRILREVFTTFSNSAKTRESLPVFLLFQSIGGTRTIRFRGLVVPGSPLLDRDEQLAAIWRSEGGERFQNYRAKFTALDVPIVSRDWLNDILAGTPMSSNAPEAWVSWVKTLKYLALMAPTSSLIRSKDEQLPAPGDREGWSLLEAVYVQFAPAPVSFERAAVEIARLAVPLPTTMDVTRPTADGGRDAVGNIFLGPSSDPIWLSMALEAKCYNPGHTSVGVKETSRLVSRLKHRDVGFMVTTSYVAKQAYEELRGDGHPVVVLAGRDIVDVLRRRGIGTPERFDDWARTLTS